MVYMFYTRNRRHSSVPPLPKAGWCRSPVIQMYLIVQWSANCGLRATKYHGLGESILKKWR